MRSCGEAVAIEMAAGGETEIDMIPAVNSKGEVISPWYREMIADYAADAQMTPKEIEPILVSVSELLPNKYQ